MKKNNTNLVLKGAWQAVNKCMKVKAGEKVVIVTDMKALKVGNALKNAALKKTKNVGMFVLENYGKRPLPKLPDEIRKSLAKCNVSFFAANKYAKGKLNELVTIRRVIQKTVTSHGARHAGMPGVTVEMMKTGMNADYGRIHKISKKIYDIVKKAKKIRVTNSLGTDITAAFSKSRKWVICDGMIKNGHWSNLPDGEVFTAPLNVEGKAVVELLGDVFISNGLLKSPMTFTIKNNRVVKVEHKSKKLVNGVEKYIKQDKNANRVGEFAIGTNIFLKKFVGSMLQDEKFPGVHIAFGYPYPKMTKANWSSKAHMDVVMRKTTIVVDGRKIMDKGKFLV